MAQADDIKELRTRMTSLETTAAQTKTKLESVDKSLSLMRTMVWGLLIATLVSAGKCIADTAERSGRDGERLNSIDARLHRVEDYLRMQSASNPDPRFLSRAADQADTAVDAR